MSSFTGESEEASPQSLAGVGEAGLAAVRCGKSANIMWLPNLFVDHTRMKFDFFELTTEPIDINLASRRVVPPHCGATVTLDGYVRQYTDGRETLYLFYEAYEPMALKEMETLGRLAHEKYSIGNIGIVHRLGRLEIGETSVVIAVAAPHRRPAFDACEWLITELKRIVPIWKKEVYADGEQWIEGDRDHSLLT